MPHPPPEEKKGDWIAKPEIHSTCRHSNKYDYCCGECMRKALSQVESTTRLAVIEEVADKIDELIDQNDDGLWSGMETAVAIRALLESMKNRTDDIICKHCGLQKEEIMKMGMKGEWPYKPCSHEWKNLDTEPQK